GFSEADMADFLAGPPYLPFGWMGCLDGWGGPLPKSWIDLHAELEKRILARERSLGMTPVLQGFTGHVPPATGKRFPDAHLYKVRWAEWETFMLDPLDTLFPRFAQVFLEEQKRLFGTDHLYAADTFIEMTPPSGESSSAQSALTLGGNRP
ncbi:MAG: alpha-N-acetylglucosaminidase, partial [Candidatus Omnitrophica bacterium]|nr:alpha-N-acetylglucosaminidase [Candidatus Omnitrophota bacterium]